MELLKPSAANFYPLTILGFLERAATVYADCPSIVYNTNLYTWSQTYRRCLQVASSLSSIGIQRHDVVSVVAPNIPAMYELHFAVPMCGAILNNINTLLDARTISALLCHSESKLVFVDQESSSVIHEAISFFPPNSYLPLLVLIEDGEVSLPPISNTAKFVTTYSHMVDNGDPDFKWIHPKSEWDPMILNYTSGTTSSPKGVVHSYRGIFIITVVSLINWSIPAQSVYLWTLPMFHVNGWSFTWGMAAVGGTNICLRKFDVLTTYSLIKRHGVTHMCGAPVVLNMLSNSPKVETLTNPVHFLTAGAPPPAVVIYRSELLGFIVSHGYGLTETAGIILSCAWKKHWNSLPGAERAKLKERQGVKTIGLVEVDVLDPRTGESVNWDGTSLGEIVLRGGSVMLGYLKDPEATSKCMREDGWFYTGDVGVIHPDSYLEIKDQSKDVIISSGENICSAEVESVLYSNPAVNEAAVVARPDEFWGETPCVFLSLKTDLVEKPSEKEIIDFCRIRLPHYMAPKKVVFRDELPKTSRGKLKSFF